MKHTVEQLKEISDKAFAAAEQAAKEYIEKHGEPLFCGFAWVNIVPGNSPIANYLKKNNLAEKSYRRGVDVWNPSNHMTQSMDVKEAGAEAFAKVLREHGYNAWTESRAD